MFFRGINGAHIFVCVPDKKTEKDQQQSLVQGSDKLAFLFTTLQEGKELTGQIGNMLLSFIQQLLQKDSP
jgi:hypothetical protein